MPLIADRFIRLNPDHPEADYAQYMKGLSSYASNDSMVSRYLPGDETGRDIGGARDAIDDFKQLLERYPDSEFAEDATLRLIYVRNQLAEYEVNGSDNQAPRKPWARRGRTGVRPSIVQLDVGAWKP